ncbi:hypothetical protein [Streptomyces sp. SAI-127]|nr:hypothetical protein [Streptomyces sp. SAI-127]MDH6488562.1 hypothetical protein [Streptomyces sp. SAI-127]
MREPWCRRHLLALDAQITAHRELIQAATHHRSTLAAHLLTGVLVPE